MEGPKNTEPKDRGVILRVAEQIVQAVQESRIKSTGAVDITVTGSYLEIYQENLRDLLSDEHNDHLKIRMDPHSASGKELHVEGLTERLLVTEQDYIKMVTTATSRRTIADTNMNEVSSRSHAVLTLIIKQYQTVKSAKIGEADVGGMKRSKIHLIDLAGMFYFSNHWFRKS